MLNRILAEKDEETGKSIELQQLIDEGLTILLAGHETTANSTAFTFYLIASHPDVYKKVRKILERNLLILQ